MNIEDIKVGDFYNYRLQAKLIADTHVILEDAYGIRYRLSRNEIETLSPANGTKNTETAPKYDPSRKFRKGDKVRVVEWNGRRPQCEALLGKETIVLRDESPLGVRIQIGESGESYCTPETCFLELVTPVEERKPYYINEIYDIDDGNLIGYEVARGDTRDSIFYGGENHLRTIEQAKERAEAERDLLNAEHRKEQL